MADKPKKDVLTDDKVFTKTAFAVRIDQLEAGIKWERSQIEAKNRQIFDLSRQFQLMSISLSKIATASENEGRCLWIDVLKYLPPDFKNKLEAAVNDNDGKPAKIFVDALVQALKVYGMSRIGEIKNAKA